MNQKDDRKDYFRMYFRKYRQNPENRAKHLADLKRWQIANVERRRAYSRIHCRIYARRVREKILSAYGNKCVCCEEAQYEFLVIDHIDGGGGRHRKEVGSGTKFYLWLKKNNYPKGFQVLCHNCNMAKAFFKKCPHQEPIK